MEQELMDEFLLHATGRLEENTRKIKICFNDLSDDDMWLSPNEVSNSIGNMILHLCGNIRQYIISSLGHKEDIRERDKEFSTKGGFNKEQLMNLLQDTIHEAVSVIKKVDGPSLLKIRSVQGYSYSGLGIIFHVVEHFSYHTGQVIFYTKLLKNKDLGIYAGIDLNKKNRN